MKKTWAQELFAFYKNLQPPQHLPNNIEWLYPQQHKEVMQLVKRFFDKYYADKAPRRLFLGINPGRFGAGVTGVNFTAPKQLKEECGIDHNLKMQSELSAEFIYDMINAYGGTDAFYNDYFIGAVCPLGFIKDGININYYDDKQLQVAVTPFITESINQLLQLNFKRDKCFCIGGEKNYKFLNKLNQQEKWFEKVVPLPHPRFILQYRRKQKEEYIQFYLEALSA